MSSSFELQLSFELRSNHGGNHVGSRASRGVCRARAEADADTKGAWGKFSASGMLAHLNDSYRMCTGELTVKSKNLPLRYTPIKQLVIYVLPFPKGAPTAPELIARCDGAELEDEKQALCANFERLAGVKPGDPLQEHPAFGALTYKDYGVADGEAHRASLPAVRALIRRCSWRNGVLIERARARRF